MKIIKYFFKRSLMLLFAGNSLFGQSNEGVKYPTRTNFFNGALIEHNSKTAMKDKSTNGNYLAFDWSPSENNQIVTSVAGFEQGNSGLHFKAHDTRAVFSNVNTTAFNENGFTIAFWTKWPYVNKTSNQTVSLLTLSDGTKDIWQTGIAYDRRVYIKRQANISATDNSGSPVFWNLKFWNPEHADIDKAVISNSNDWFFVVIVQEKSQIRMHIGMPNGNFDCMYLNYGLDDQTEFKNTILPKLQFFGNDEELYVDDISIWDKPLCREEVFEFFKDSRGATGSTFPLNNSAIKNTVISDDDARMKSIGRTNGCLTSIRSNRLKSSKLAKNVLTLNNEDSKIENKPSVLIVYPNPTRSEININVSSLSDVRGTMKISLNDLQGRRISSTQKSIRVGVQTINWLIPNAEALSNGIYLLNITYNGKHFSKKIAIDCGCN